MPRRAPDGGVPAPAVPEDRLDGDWERVEDVTETLFGVQGADVRGHTVVYEDRDLRAAVRTATDGRVDQSWRFFFATRLAFRPPLAPAIGPAMVLPSVKTEAVRQFADDLGDRGVANVERGRRERVRTESRSRVSLRQVTGELSTGDGAVPVEGWVGAWADGDIHLAGGAYPRTSLAEYFESDGHGTDTGADGGDVLGDGAGADETDVNLLLARRSTDYRTNLLDLIRAVG